MNTIRGLTWGHRRAIAPLKASAEAFLAAADIFVDWQVRSLALFEHQSFSEAVRWTDLIVFDHPHIGDVVERQLLHPLDDLVGSSWHDEKVYMGQSLASYRAGASTWAVPIDAATIHSIYRPDLLDRLGQPVPRTWSESIGLMKTAKRAGLTCLLAAQGHHLLLTLASLMGNIGHPWCADGDGIFLDRHGLSGALDLAEEALDASDRERSLSSNAIDVHETLTTEPDAAYCPAAYGYATYGEAELWPRRLAFGAFPGAGPIASEGTIIGGAGVGITRSCRDVETASRYLTYLSLGETQTGVFAAASGQPARIEGWRDPAIDVRFNGFFSATAETMQGASVRPRFAGYSVLEQRLASTLHRGLASGASRGSIVDNMIHVAAQG